MNQAPTAEYRKYWRLQDNHKQLYEDAKFLLMRYVQSWGQTNFQKTDSLTQVAIRMGYEVKTVPSLEGEGLFGWSFDEAKYPLFDEFVEKVRNIRRWSFEGEVGQLADLIVKYTIEKPWYKKVWQQIRWWSPLPEYPREV